MSISLTSGTRPQLSVGRDVFNEHRADGRYANVPIEYFTVEGRQVYLDAVVAEQLVWQIDEHHHESGSVNINAPAQRLSLNGEVINIAAGAFCSWVTEDEIVGFPEESDTV